VGLIELLSPEDGGGVTAWFVKHFFSLIKSALIPCHILGSSQMTRRMNRIKSPMKVSA
jgi:hypothetical protein